MAPRIVILAALVLLAFPAQASPERLGWADIERVAGAAFDAGYGAAASREAEGLDRAVLAVPGPVTGLALTLGSELPVSGASESIGETWWDAMLTVELGRRAAAARDALRAEHAAREAAREAERIRFADRVRGAWLGWWAALVLAENLEAHAASLHEALGPLREAAGRGSLTRLDLEDLEVEEARLALEIASQRRYGAEREAALQALVGFAVAPVDDLGAAYEPGTAGGAEPWAPLLAHLDGHPAMRALAARAEAARAAAAAADRAQPLILQGGLTGRRERDGVVSLGLGLGLSVPFGNPQAPERERQLGLAGGAELEGRRLLVELRAQVAAASRRHRAAVAYREALAQGLEARLEARSALFEEALRRGQISLERVIRARRDLLEALRERLSVNTEIMAGRARAAAMHTWLVGRRDGTGIE